MEVPGYESDRQRILVRDWPDGPEREVAPAWDRSPGALAWSSDGRPSSRPPTTWAPTPSSPSTWPPAGERMLVKGGSDHAPSVAGGRVVYTHDDLGAPADRL